MKTKMKIVAITATLILTSALQPILKAQWLVTDMPHTVITAAIKFIQSDAFGDIVEGVKKLEQISNVVRQAKRGVEIASRSTKLLGKINTISTALASDQHILPNEYAGLTKDFAKMAGEIQLAVGDLSNIVQANGTSMDDAGRLDLVNQAFSRIDKVENTLGQIYKKYYRISMSRAKTNEDIAATSKLYSAANRTIESINNKTVSTVSTTVDNPLDKASGNIDLAEYKKTSSRIAEEASVITGQVNSFVAAQEKAKRGEFAFSAALQFPLRSDADCKELDDDAEDADPDTGWANYLYALAAKCHTEVDSFNDQQKIRREEYVDQQMQAGHFTEYYQSLRKTMIDDRLKKLYATYGRTYNN